MSEISQQIEAIEGRMKALKLPISFMLDRAGIPPATWSRWKAETQKPTKEKWDAVVEEVAGLELLLKTLAPMMRSFELLGLQLEAAGKLALEDGQSRAAAALAFVLAEHGIVLKEGGAL